MSDFSRSKVAFSSEARAKLLRGMTTVAEAVGCTLGPKGKTVLIQKQSGTPTVTKDGVTVARSINLKDPIERMGAELIKEAASQTNDLAGDGTTTTTILTHAMVVEATRCLDAGFSSTRLIEGVKHAAAAVEDGIRQSALKVEDHAVLKDVATISANNDKTTGTLIASAFEKVGRDGIITVEDAKGMSTTLETIEGMQFERGYTSPYFITHSEKMIALYDDALVLVTDRKVATLAQIVPVLELVHRSGRPLLIVADDIETEALQGLVLNKTKSNLKVVAVRAPGYADHKKELLQDMAVLAGATFVSVDTGLALEKVQMKDLGLCRKVIVNDRSTTLIGTGKTSAAIEQRADEIRGQLEDVTLTPEARMKLRIRLARLANGVAIVKVGGSTEMEMVEKKYRIEDALNATRAAVEEGILPGGGLTLARMQLKKKEYDREFQAGVDIVLKACQVPFRKIVSNAGGLPDVLINDLSKVEQDMGYDALRGEFVDMLQAGIIDPAKVTRLAVKHAVSVACTFLSLDAVVFEDV
jgi:chaperonin GroEL